MESQTSEPVTEVPSKHEVIISKSQKVGNFDSNSENPNPKKNIYSYDLDLSSEYNHRLPHLPQGYGFTGGVARGALLELLGDKPPKVRDYDIETISEFSPDIDIKNTVTQYLEHGERSKINQNNSLISYFSSRDFTINEVFISGNKLYFSERAIQDMQNKTIRPTEYESRPYDEDASEISPRILIRSLLLEIEFIKLYGHGNHQDIESWQWYYLEKDYFNVALGLEKASQKQIGIEYLKKMIELKVINWSDIPEGLNKKGLQRLARLLKHWLVESSRGDFQFSDDFFNQEYDEDWEDNDEEIFSKWYEKSISRAVKMKNIDRFDLEY